MHLALGDAAPRRLVHRRRVECEAWRRDDGLLDVDAWIIDTRGHDMTTLLGPLPAGAPLHEMGLRLTLDAALRITEARAISLHGPSPECLEVAPAYAKLVGLVVGPGLREQARALFRGPAGCTHLTELLPAMVTVAMQAAYSQSAARSLPLRSAPAAEAKAPARSRAEQPGVIGGCHAWRPDGALARVLLARRSG